MPLLETDLLQSHRELRLAHLALGIITMGYVWQEGEEDKIKVTQWNKHGAWDSSVCKGLLVVERVQNTLT